MLNNFGRFLPIDYAIFFWIILEHPSRISLEYSFYIIFEYFFEIIFWVYLVYKK
jgi:hypothetical protein